MVSKTINVVIENTLLCYLGLGTEGLYGLKKTITVVDMSVFYM